MKVKALKRCTDAKGNWVDAGAVFDAPKEAAAALIASGAAKAVSTPKPKPETKAKKVDEEAPY